MAFGYDGQTEIIDAAEKYAVDYAHGLIDPTKFTPEDFNKYLYSNFKAPDLIIRTSNEQRLSGFMTYQSAYSELAFVDKYWPEITEQDIDDSIKNFNSRDRRFGK